MISIDTVYQKVLAIANKEQRGYITPQEFNLFADQAQMEIFQQYFYDLDQFERRLGSDGVGLLSDKIQIFKHTPLAMVHGQSLPGNTYMVDDVWLSWRSSEKKPIHLQAKITRRTTVQRVDRNEVQGINSSPLLKSSLTYCYYTYKNKIYFIWPNTNHTNLYKGTPNWRVNLIKRPSVPNWTYVIDPSSQSALYDANSPSLQNFEIHMGDENTLVIKILQLAGISMKDMGLTQLAGQKEANTKQQEKQ